jgi:hypothetical protein
MTAITDEQIAAFEGLDVVQAKFYFDRRNADGRTHREMVEALLSASKPAAPMGQMQAAEIIKQWIRDHESELNYTEFARIDASLERLMMHLALAASPAVPAQSPALIGWWDSAEASGFRWKEGIVRGDLSDGTPIYANSAAPAQSGDPIYQVRVLRSMMRPWIDTEKEFAEKLEKEGRHEMRVLYAAPQLAQTAPTREPLSPEARAFYARHEARMGRVGPAQPVEQTARTYTTKAGEAVAGIALRQCGNEADWRHILACNPKFADMLPSDYFPVGTVLTLPPAPQPAKPLTRCAASRDGECAHAQCPQLRDGEPAKTGRHCPIDNCGEDD